MKKKLSLAKLKVNGASQLKKEEILLLRGGMKRFEQIGGG